MRILLSLLLGGWMLPAFGQSYRAAPAVSVLYTSVRANDGPRQCGCFHLNGGTAEVSVPFATHAAAVADVSGSTASAVNGGATGLSLLTYTVGPRVRLARRRYEVFAQALAGGVHGFQSYFPDAPGSSRANGFALVAGGGVDVRVSRTVMVRAFEADYLLTRLPNGSTGEQNNLRLSAGVVFSVR